MALKILLKAASSVLVILCGASSLATAGQEVTAQKGPQAESAGSPRNLLIRSYFASQQLVPGERAMALMYLALTAGAIEPAYNRLWSEELFHSALQLPRDWNRVAYEKNALEALSQSDPQLALQLFSQMDDPIPTESGKFPEDVRAFAARRVFGTYWNLKGPAGLEEITSQARHLGDTGQYPYVAMIAIVRDLAPSSQNEAEAVFNEAVGYFSRGSRFGSANPDFVQFLNGVWDVLPSTLKHMALGAAVDQLTRESSSDSNFRGRSRTRSKVVEFKDRNRQLLFELLPRIEEVDPQWAKRITDKESWLTGATEPGGVRRSDSALIPDADAAPPDRLGAAENLLIQQQTLSQVEQEVNHDPDAALITSGSLTNPEFEAIALADIAVGFAKKDPAKGGKLLGKARDIISTLKGTPGKVAALFAVAKAEYALGNRKGMATSWSRAVDLGEELFQQDMETHPGGLAYQAGSFNTLEEMLRFGGAVDPQMALAALGGMQNQLLQVYLPIFAADGIFRHDQLHR